MIKILVKKELTRFFGGKFSVKNKPGQSLLTFVLLGFLYFVFFMLFCMLSSYIIEPLMMLGMDWYYFDIVALVATVLGVVGSVFLCYQLIYEANDNDLLLSMPIKPRDILISRILSLYVEIVIFESVVLIPAVIIYNMNKINLLSLISQVILIVVLPLVALVLSLILGWLLANLFKLFSARIKKFIQVAASLIFMVAYFYFYSNLQMDVVQSLVIDSTKMVINIDNEFHPLALLGNAFCGNLMALIIVVAFISLISAISIKLVSMNFISLAIVKKDIKSKKVKVSNFKQNSIFISLWKKEWLKYLDSPIYILNSSLGSIMVIPLMIIIYLNMGNFTPLIAMLNLDINLVKTLIVIAILIASVGVNFISSVSVSIEGNSFWIIKSLPLKMIDVINAKIMNHFMITFIPALIALIIGIFMFNLSLINALLILVMTILYTLVCAMIGVMINICFPKLEFNQEAQVVKQSLSAFLGSLISLLISIVIVVLLYFNLNRITLLLLIINVIMIIVAITLYQLLRSSSSKKMEQIY